MSTERPSAVVVDDDAGVREVHRRFLTDRFTVETAANGVEGLSAITESTAVLVVDWKMPGLSGIEVARGVRSRGYDCTVVLVSGSDPPFDERTAPVDAVLTKPLTQSELLDSIATGRSDESAVAERTATAESASTGSVPVRTSQQVGGSPASTD
jgi:CheY-like chemotaxis protein